jgi:hypothetical protein
MNLTKAIIDNWKEIVLMEMIILSTNVFVVLGVATKATTQASLTTYDCFDRLNQSVTILFGAISVLSLFLLTQLIIN